MVVCRCRRVVHAASAFTHLTNQIIQRVSTPNAVTHHICMSIYMCIYTQPYDVLLKRNSNELELVFLFAYTPTHTHTTGWIFFVFIFKCNVHKQTRTRCVCAIYSRRNFQRFVSRASTTNTDVCFHGLSLCVANNTSVVSRKKKKNKKIKINPSTRNDIIPKKKTEKIC